MSEKIENISPSIFVYFQLPTIPCNFLPFSTQTPVKYLYLSCICNWLILYLIQSWYLGARCPQVLAICSRVLFNTVSRNFYGWDLPFWPEPSTPSSSQRCPILTKSLGCPMLTTFFNTNWVLWSFIFSGPRPGALIKVDAKLQEHSDLFLASDSIS